MKFARRFSGPHPLPPGHRGGAFHTEELSRNRGDGRHLQRWRSEQTVSEADTWRNTWCDVANAVHCLGNPGNAVNNTHE